jgi:phosphoglycolate phosphatase-like HAD superfamily hydrolase
MHYKNILFDFDGTLADTREGIIRTVQGTLQHMSLPTADPDYHRQFMRSYNIPEFMKGPVTITPHEFADVLKGEAINVKYK